MIMLRYSKLKSRYITKNCFYLILQHFRDMYLPLLFTDTDLMSDSDGFIISHDKLMDILHTLLENFEVLMGVSKGKVIFQLWYKIHLVFTNVLCGI